MPPASKILETMLERLYASLVQGPGMNCRPHSSRQRVDLGALSAFQHTRPSEIVPKLLTGAGEVKIVANVPAFESDLDEKLLNESQRASKRAFDLQQKLLRKLREMAEDAND